MPELNQYQNVYIELSDGRIGLFSGPVFITEKDKELIIKNVNFSPAKDIPDGLSWEHLSEEVERLTPKRLSS